MTGIIILGLLVLLVILAIGMYNSLVRLKVQIDNAWADIDVQLKRRYDLIPNLVETVKGYAGHEKGTLEAVINARNRAMNATSPGDKAQAENMLSGALKSLFALAEAYPQLRAIESFTSLQNSLSQIEDTVQNARRYYNAIVRVACFFFLAPSSSITTRELRIEKFDSEIVVAANGTIDVTENITAHFIGGPWHGLYRDIPVEYVTPQGLNYTLFLTVKSISDGNGNKLRFETSRVRHYRKLKIFVPNADNSTQTISIEYSVSDALRCFEDHDELYW